MAITRRSFFAGLGAVSVGLLFKRKLDAVLESLENDLVDEPVAPDQRPSAAEIVVRLQETFRAEHLIVASTIAPFFVIDDISIGQHPQLLGDPAMPAAVPAELFTLIAAVGLNLDLKTATAGTDIRFRVRYVGSDPAGAPFQAALIGCCTDSGGRKLLRQVLPIDSGCPITA